MLLLHPISLYFVFKKQRTNNSPLVCARARVFVSASTDSSRVKRMCVAERRQPYSGDDWCSGGESDEDEKGFFSKCLNICF